MPKEANRRFLDLQVNEVSLVDTPANQVEFLVAKRLQEDTMPGNKDQNTPATENSDVTKVALDVEKIENDAVQKALDKVNSLVDSIVSDVAKGDTKSDAEGGDKSESVEKGGQPTDFDPIAFAKSKFEAAGLKDEALTKAMEEFEKGFQGKKAPMKKVQKDANGDASEPAQPAAPSASEIAGTVLDAIAKAKHFTPDRIEQLQNAIDTLQKLMMEAVPVGMSPNSSVPAVAVHPNPNTTKPALAGVAKSEGQAPEASNELVSAIRDLATVVKAGQEKTQKDITDVVKRLDALESPHNPSRSIDDGNTETQVEKGGSLFKGIV